MSETRELKEFWDRNALAWSEVIAQDGVGSRRSTTPALLEEILRWRPRSLLDAGCGEGFLAAFAEIRALHYRGFDGSAELVATARARRGDFFTHLSYEDWVGGARPWPAGFDLIVFNFSLFEKELAPLLRQASRWLNPEGHLLIQTLHPTALPEGSSGWQRENFQSMPGHFVGSMPWYGRRESEWREQFTAAGLQVTGVRGVEHEGRPASMIFTLQAGLS